MKTIIAALILLLCTDALAQPNGDDNKPFKVIDRQAATAGMYADEGDVIIYDKELNSAVNDTGIECDAPSGTNTVYFTLACAQ